MSHFHILADGTKLGPSIDSQIMGASGEMIQTHFHINSDTKERIGEDMNFLDHTHGMEMSNPIPIKSFEKEEPKTDELQTESVKGVEVFAVGEWNGDKYEQQDLDDMVEAFNEQKEKIRPHLKLGHNEEQSLIQKDGLPAAGWIENLYSKGGKLIADFYKIPKKVAQLLKAGAYKKQSSEIYWNIKLADKTYRRFLGAVSLLGTELPAVSSLNDIISMYGLDNTCDLRKYADNGKDITIKCYHSMGEDMPNENEIKLKYDLDAANKELKESKEELKQFKSDLEAIKEAGKKNEEELNELREQNKKYSQDIETAKEEKRQADLDKQVGEMNVTPAMKPFMRALLDEDKSEYEIKEKKYSKAEVLEEIVKLGKASDVNLDESSEGGEQKNKDDELNDRIEKYASENKVSYSEAYKTIMKES